MFISLKHLFMRCYCMYLHTCAHTHAHTNTDILHENGSDTCLVQQFLCDLKYTQYTGIIIPNTGYVPNI